MWECSRERKEVVLSSWGPRTAETTIIHLRDPSSILDSGTQFDQYLDISDHVVNDSQKKIVLEG